MPKALENMLRQEYGSNDRAVYGTLNKIGAMRGPKETPKGARMEAKFVRDHGMPKAPRAGLHPGRNLGTFLHPPKPRGR